jgi:hypothetical protein
MISQTNGGYAAIALALRMTAAAQAADAPALAAAPAQTVLHCGHLLDSINGKMLGATTVVIEGGRVRDVTPGTMAPAGAKEIDLSTQTCLPGLGRCRRSFLRYRLRETTLSSGSHRLVVRPMQSQG